jgi:hypothetical protein
LVVVQPFEPKRDEAGCGWTMARARTLGKGFVRPIALDSLALRR